MRGGVNVVECGQQFDVVCEVGKDLWTKSDGGVAIGMNSQSAVGSRAAYSLRTEGPFSKATCMRETSGSPLAVAFLLASTILV